MTVRWQLCCRVLVLLVAGLWAIPSAGQGPPVTIASIAPAVATGSLSSTDSAVTLNLQGFPGAAIQLTGTWTGTVTFEVSIDGTTYTAANFTPPNSTTAVTSATANGHWSGSVVGFRYLRTRFSTASSGTVVPYVRATLGGGSGSGGGGAVTNAGTFAVQESGTLLTEVQTITHAEDSAHSSTQVGIMALAVRQDAQVDFGADGDYVPLSINDAGELRVAFSGAAGGTSLADDGDFSAGTTAMTVAGGFYQSSVTACTDGDACAVGLTAQRTQKVTLFTAAGVEIPAATTTEATHDAALTPASTVGIPSLYRASTSAPTAVTADDAVLPWASLNGATATFPVAHTVGGCTAHSIISANTVNETAMKASAGNLYNLVVTNIGANEVFFKLYNDTTANIDETDTPVYRVVVPGSASGAGVVVPIPVGMAFSTAITYRITGAIADNDTTAIAANEVLVAACYQ